MSGLVYANFAKTTISGAISNTATSIALASGSGVLFPQLTGSQYFIGVLTDAATTLNREVVKVIAISADTVTVVRAQESTSARSWIAGDYFINEITAGGLGTYNQYVDHTWNLSSPPSADVLLNPKDTATITFSSVTAVPLTIATQPGLYKIYMVVTGSNSTNSDMFVLPNNSVYANAFSRYAIEAADLEIAGFGSATSDPSTAIITGGVPGFSAAVPLNAVNYLALNTFFIDMFYGPSTSDTLNDRGPFVADMLISTTTAAKLIKSTGAIIGGAHVASSLWSDTITAWTSLGTIQLSLAGTGGSSGSMATISGVVYIQRIS